MATTSPAPTAEPESETLTAEQEMLEFADKTDDTAAVAEKMRELGFL